MASRQTRKVAPDGGYGWVATFGVSLVNVSGKKEKNCLKIASLSVKKFLVSQRLASSASENKGFKKDNSFGS